jgi:rSAM/selenodomain-associated transferase 1
MGLAQLAVFVRSPTAGEAKTRLASVLGEQGAAELYGAFVEDVLALCARVRAAGRVDLAVWSAGPPHETVARWASAHDATMRLQPRGDLGVKLGAAFERALPRYERVVIIGSDMPTLPLSLVIAAFDSLERAPLVLGPANDGGYYAIGASHGLRPRFDGVRWSTRHALADTLRANASRRAAIIAPWYDVDDPSDLAILRAHLSADPAAAPRTASRLRTLFSAQR